ncbi:MAG: DUF1349 domain-containing protein [Pseudomonadota bacterium]
MIDGMNWLNEPPFWAMDDNVLRVRSGEKTDFWQGTYYGFHRDNGHFLGRFWQGDFTASTRFNAQYDELYDQAGMMVRVDAQHWMKCGVEYTDGAMHLSVVVTNGHSDWSAQRLEAVSGAVGIRVSRLKDSLFIQYRLGDADWRMARLAFFSPDPSDVQVGLTFCSPQRAGFEAEFKSFEIGPPAMRDIH